MFRKNERHQQLGLFETVAQLPEKVRQRLERSWAGTFYQELFCRIDETKFAALYSDQPSRPNTPVNVLVGMEILKSGFGWSDEELYDAFLFDLQVRYALGLRDLATGNFELRTLYNFRHRLSRYMQQQGVNPLAEVFKQVTGEQLRAFGLKTAEQRMDATYVASNIARMSRLQLLVEVLQRVWRMLHDEDQAKLAACFAPYREDSAGQFCYRLKDSEVAAQLAAVGQLMVRLLNELAGQYHEQTTYQLLQRVVAEHFDLLPANGVPPSLPSAQAERGLSGPPQPGYADAPRAPGAADRAPEATVNVKPNGALRADALQSPDDPEATFRQTGSVGQRGYKANASETCDPENPFQLITWLQVAPNLIDDQQFLCAALPELMARTGLTKLWTDGGFTGAQARAAIRQHEIEQIPTSVRGIHLSSQQLGWHCFSWQMDSAGQPQAVTCPGGQSVTLLPGKPGHYRACFAPGLCSTCVLVAQCRSQLTHQGRERTLYVMARQVHVALTRQVSRRVLGPGHNRRAAVESTIRSLKHPFGGQKGKLPVRGQIRISILLLASALMVNLRRIWRYGSQKTEDVAEQTKAEATKPTPLGAPSPVGNLWLTRLGRTLRHLPALLFRTAAAQSIIP